MWFIAYQHPLRPGEAGVKFVGSKAEAIAERDRLELSGYVVRKIAEFRPGHETESTSSP